MLFHSSPALRRIRQLARLIRRHPDLPVHSWNNPWRSPDPPDAALPDPAQFVDSSVSNGILDGLPDPNTRKHGNCPRSRAGR
jgi:hypothetical protein